MTVKDIIEKRKRIWAKQKNIEIDRQFVEVAIGKILETKELRNEVYNEPDLLIELCFTVVDKNFETVPFFLNKVQKDLREKIYQYGKIKPIMTLKGRQQGITTFVTAFQMSYTIVRKNFFGFTLADKQQNVLSIFNDKARTVYQRLPDRLKPHEKFNSKNEFFFDKLNSSWRVAAATREVGRSKTIGFLHLSELAFFEVPFSDIQKSLGETLPKSAIKIYETTANGYNDAKELWDSGTCLNVFYVWWDTEEYSDDDVEVIEDVKDAWLIERIAWLRQKGVDDKKIAWYVKKYNSYITTNDNGVICSQKDSIRQEYPCFPEEAFIASGSCIFDSDSLQTRLDNIKDVNAEKIGYFEYNKSIDGDGIVHISNIRWVEDKKLGYIKLFIEPDERKYYVLGGDTAGDGSDRFTGQVIDNHTLKQCAVLWKTNIDEDLYAEQMYCLGKYYNWALIGIEVNFSVYPTKQLVNMEYPNLFFREQYDEIQNKVVNKFGFKTTSLTKSQIIPELQRIVRESVDVLIDKETIKEMITFVRDDAGHAGAIVGKHDDLVMGLAIAYGIRKQQYTTLKEKEEPKQVLPFALQDDDEDDDNWIDWEN